ncbi:MAG: hypothetical protein QOH65_3695, partial [Methylobacteriaceae bacterium]|nr:hypothetical protein [Methylobacteriaceae bacterium]
YLASDQNQLMAADDSFDLLHQFFVCWPE